MSYTRKTWVDRVSEYPTRRILTDTSTGTSQQVTVQRSEGTVTTNGDSFDAETMNDFEGRIASAFTTDQAAIGNLSLLETEDKDSLVEAINEVKGDIPQNVPRALGDLSNVELSTSGILDGSTLVFDANDGTWKDQKLSADKVTYDDTLAKQQGYDPLISGPDVQGALESVNFYLDNHEIRIEQLKEDKADKPTVVKNGDVFQSGSTSLPSSTSFKTVGSFTVAAGIYLFIGSCRFEKNANGYRKFCLSETEDGGAIGAFNLVMTPPVTNQDITQNQLSSIIAPTAKKTYYFNAAQNSGSPLLCTPRYTLVKIA